MVLQQKSVFQNEIRIFTVVHVAYVIISVRLLLNIHKQFISQCSCVLNIHFTALAVHVAVTSSIEYSQVK